MTSLRTLICDDEPLALDRLRGLLDQCNGVELVSAASGGEEAVTEIARLAPDLVLLDIEMPKLGGFDVVDALSQRCRQGDPPLVVFVTAHPHYAFEAFDSGAIDFISKPVRLHRLQRALERARSAFDQRQSARRLETLTATLEALRAAVPGRQDEPHIWVQKKSERIRLAVQDIEFVQAEGEYIRLHVGEASYLHRCPLGGFAEQVGTDRFLRVHRSAVINVGHVAGLGRSSWGGLLLRMQSGRSVAVGRNYRQAVRSLIDASG